MDASDKNRTGFSSFASLASVLSSRASSSRAADTSDDNTFSAKREACRAMRRGRRRPLHHPHYHRITPRNQLRVANLADWTAQGNSPWDLILFLNGRPFPGLHPISIDAKRAS